MSSTFTPAGIVRAVRAVGGNPDLSVRARKTSDGVYAVTMPARWTARYLRVHPDNVQLGRAAELMSDALGFAVWVYDVCPVRRGDMGPGVRFTVSLARC